MNGIVWFFSLWLLILTGLPCPDAECHAQSNQVTHSSTSHSDDQDHKAPCSPFCHCTTCLGFAIPRVFTYALPDQLSAGAVLSQIFDYQSPAYSNVTFVIWQPPKF